MWIRMAECHTQSFSSSGGSETDKMAIEISLFLFVLSSLIDLIKDELGAKFESLNEII